MIGISSHGRYCGRLVLWTKMNTTTKWTTPPAKNIHSHSHGQSFIPIPRPWISHVSVCASTGDERVHTFRRFQSWDCASDLRMWLWELKISLWWTCHCAGGWHPTYQGEGIIGFPCRPLWSCADGELPVLSCWLNCWLIMLFCCRAWVLVWSIQMMLRGGTRLDARSP